MKSYLKNLTEIIISIALIAIVLVFLASLLVTVNDINKESATNSTYLIGKSLLIKNIENDLKNATSLTITECSVTSIYSDYGNPIVDEDNNSIEYFSGEDNSGTKSNLKANFCYEFDYGSSDTAKLGLFYYKKSNTYIISYVHGDIRTRMELPHFEKNPNNVTVEGNNAKLKANKFTTSSGTIETPPLENITGFFTMTIPIIGEDSKDYSIIISDYN